MILFSKKALYNYLHLIFFCPPIYFIFLMFLGQSILFLFTKCIIFRVIFYLLLSLLFFEFLQSIILNRKYYIEYFKRSKLYAVQNLSFRFGVEIETVSWLVDLRIDFIRSMFVSQQILFFFFEDWLYVLEYNVELNVLAIFIKIIFQIIFLINIVFVFFGFWSFLHLDYIIFYRGNRRFSLRYTVCVCYFGLGIYFLSFYSLFYNVLRFYIFLDFKLVFSAINIL